MCGSMGNGCMEVYTRNEEWMYGSLENGITVCMEVWRMKVWKTMTDLDQAVSIPSLQRPDLQRETG